MIGFLSVAQVFNNCLTNFGYMITNKGRGQIRITLFASCQDFTVFILGMGHTTERIYKST